MCVQSLEALKTIDKKGITEDMFGDIFLEVFTINGSDGKEIELKPNGKNIPVTFQNRFEWAALVETHRKSEFKVQGSVYWWSKLTGLKLRQFEEDSHQ